MLLLHNSTTDGGDTTSRPDCIWIVGNWELVAIRGDHPFPVRCSKSSEAAVFVIPNSFRFYLTVEMSSSICYPNWSGPMSTPPRAYT